MAAGVPRPLDPDILGRFRSDLRRAGVAGEERLASLIYLGVTSRILPWGDPFERPVSVITKGTTSTGKSDTTQTTLRFFPASAYIDLGSMSRRFLFYDERPYSHIFLVVSSGPQFETTPSSSRSCGSCFPRAASSTALSRAKEGRPPAQS